MVSKLIKSPTSNIVHSFTRFVSASLANASQVLKDDDSILFFGFIYQFSTQDVIYITHISGFACRSSRFKSRFVPLVPLA